MTDEQIRKIVAPYTRVEFATQELEGLLVTAKNDLTAAGATPADLRRAAALMTNAVIKNAAISHRARTVMLPVFETVFGEPMPALRARVAADHAAWQAMKAGSMSDDEIEAALARGHQRVRGLGWRVFGWTILFVAAWRYSRVAAALVLLVPVVLFVIKAFVRGASKTPRINYPS